MRPSPTTIASRKKKALDTKSVVAVYYGEVPIDADNNLWKCNICGNIRKTDIKTQGYTNLMGHIKTKHNDMLDTLSTDSNSNLIQAPLHAGQKNLQFAIDPKAHDIYKWIDWVVMDELELSFCEQERTRGYSNISKICTKTLKKYILKLHTALKMKVKQMLEGIHAYALIYDGWTEDNTHFIGMCFIVHTCSTHFS